MFPQLMDERSRRVRASGNPSHRLDLSRPARPASFDPPGTGVPRGSRVSWCAGIIAVLCSAGALGVTDVRADQEQPAAVPAGAQFTSVTKDMTTDAERIVIPLNRSVLIETSQPVATLQSVSPEIAVVQSISPTQFMISGASFGETQVIAWSKDGGQKIFNVTVEMDLQALRDALHRVDPRSQVEVTPVQGSVILTGQVSSAAAAQQVLEVTALFMPQGEQVTGGLIQNHLQISGEQQVLLRVTVAEVSRVASRELGVDGFLAGDDFQDLFVVNQIGAFNPVNIGAAADVNVQNTIPFLTGSEGIPLRPETTLSLGFPRVQMQVFIKAMAENALLKLLAEPNLIAISGETASFLAGGEFPFPVPQSGGGVGAITIEWKEFGVRLNFTPVVLGNETVRLRIAPELSNLDFTNAVSIQGTLVPSLSQRRTETTVEIGNGQTLAIAGMLNESIRGVARRVPGLGDLPVLGALFRSVEYQKNLTELVVLVTPEIIAPMNPDQVSPVPGQFHAPPNDWQLYMLGMIEGEPFADASGPDDAMKTWPAPRVLPVSSEPEKLTIHGPWGESTYEDIR